MRRGSDRDNTMIAKAAEASSPLPPLTQRQRTRRMIVIAGTMILLLSCVLKLDDWSAHHRSIATLLNRMDTIAELLASLIVVIEFVPTALLLARLPRAANLWSLVFFVMVTIGWIAANHSVSRPTCSCFGQWSQFTLIVDGLPGVLIRNGAFIAITGAGRWISSRDRLL